MEAQMPRTAEMSGLVLVASHIGATMSHRGEGAIYRDSHDRPSPPGVTSKSRSGPADVAEMAQESTPSTVLGESSEQATEQATELPKKEGVYPDPSNLSVSLPAAQI